MAVKYEVVHSRNVEGRDKPVYTKVGVVVETKRGGLALKLESIPVAFDGWLNLFEPKPKDDARPARRDESEDDGDRIPF